MLAWLEKQGEQTSLNNIWHRANETPQIKSDDRSVAVLLCCYRIFDVKPVESWEVAHYYNEYGFLNLGQTIKENDVIRWAYLDELIEKQGEPKEHDVCDNCDQQGSCVSPCCVKLVEKNGEQKPAAWSEEDETMVNSIISFCDFKVNIELHNEGVKEASKKVLSWLGKLKDRVQPQPKQEWSEEDEDKFNEIKTALNGFYCEGNAEELTNWLKSLRPQSQWKPSDEQLDSLYDVLNPCDGFNREVLESLYEQLKKLKG